MGKKYIGEQVGVVRAVAARWVAEGKWAPNVCDCGSDGFIVEDSEVISAIEAELANPTKAGSRSEPVRDPVETTLPCLFCGCVTWDFPGTTLEHAVHSSSGSGAKLESGRSLYGSSSSYWAVGSCISCGTKLLFEWEGPHNSHSPHERMVSVRRGGRPIRIRQGV